MKIFENRKIKGAISIFLVIITIPTMLLSAVLIDGSRMASARGMVQEAADLAAASALASYDQTLKDEFGLFAVDDNEKLEEIYKESLNATLLAYGMSGDDEYSERLWDIMKTTMTGQESYMGASFLNLYDFSVDECRVEPMYCLAEQSVLENQMVEYAKFRGLYVMTDRMGVFSNLGNIKEEAEKNQVTSEVMGDKMETDESNADADKELAKLRKEIDSLNTAIDSVKTAKNDYISSLWGKMEQIRIENIDTDEKLSADKSRAAKAYEKKQEALKNAAEAACQQAGKVIKQARKAEKEVEKAIGNLDDFKSDNQSKASGNEAVGELIADADTSIDLYKKEYLPQIQEIINDPILIKMEDDTNIKSNLSAVMTEIHQAVTAYIKTIEKLRKEMKENKKEEGEDDDSSENDKEEEEDEITEYYYNYLNSAENTVDIGAAINENGSLRGYGAAVNGLLSHIISKKWDSDRVNPSKKYEGVSGSTINEDFAKEKSGAAESTETSLEGEAQRGEVEQSVYKARPSKTWVSEQGKSNNTSFYNKNNDLTASKNILKQGGRSMLLDIGEAARDDVLCLSYMFGTFKTRLTGVKRFSSEGMSAADKALFYMPKWRYAHPEGELDMRFSPKKDRITVLRSEVEYLVYGNRSDSANEAAVYATIFAERLANNLIAMYSEQGIKAACHAAACVACAASLGIVPEPVFFWIFLTAWATAETILEMEYLVSEGYRIPLLKTSKNILLKANPRGNGPISNYGEKGFFVSYEDYLLILLLAKGRDKRIMRTADVIEMNMKKKGEQDFTMAKAYTYLYADTKLSLRYLFGSTMPFQTDYEENGYGGRMHFTNTIYLGY